MLLQTILLNAIYKLGNSIGPILCWVFILLLSVEIIYVFVRYVIKSNK